MTIERLLSEVRTHQFFTTYVTRDADDVRMIAVEMPDGSTDAYYPGTACPTEHMLRTSFGALGALVNVHDGEDGAIVHEFSGEE